MGLGGRKGTWGGLLRMGPRWQDPALGVRKEEAVEQFGGGLIFYTPLLIKNPLCGEGKKKESTLPQASVVALNPFSMLADFYGPHLCPRHHSLQRTTVLSPEGPPGAPG